MNKYLVSDIYDEDSIAIDWSKIPEDFLDKVSKDLYNISSVTNKGDIAERTVIFIKPVDEFPYDDIETVEFCDIILGIEPEFIDEDDEEEL